MNLRFKQKLFSAFIILAIVGGILFLLEVFIRIFSHDINPQDTDSGLMKDSVYFSSPGLVPHAEGFSFGKKIRVDEHGFLRSRHPFDPKKKSKFIFGDSVAMGTGVETDSTFSVRLQDYYGDSLNIVNVSLLGYNALDYLNLANYFFSENKFNIEEVLVVFCLNDIYPDRSNVLMMSSNSFLGPLAGFLKANSHLYLWLKGKFFDRQKAYFDHDLEMYRNDALVNSQAKHLYDIMELCSRHGIGLNVIILPYEYQLRNKEKKELRLPQEKIRKLLEEKNIPALDPFDYLSQRIASSKDAYLFADGIHFSSYGHGLITGFLIENL